MNHVDHRGIRPPTIAISILTAIALLLAPPLEHSFAITISIIGGEGAPGEDGSHQPSGADGEAGGAGGDVNALANTNGDSANTADAAGGVGGRGGGGGSATDPNGNGGRGGYGGLGGDAVADARTWTNRITATASAIAEGGGGGNGGDGGDGGLFGSGGSGVPGGHGGHAQARASAEAQRPGAPAISTAIAIGGRGGDGGVGGSPNPVDGGQGGSGGFAMLGPVIGRAIGGDVQLRARAVGGAGGDGTGANDPGGIGASVNVHDVLEGSTTGAMVLSQEAVGGAGGNAEGWFAGHGGSANNSLRLIDNEAASILAQLISFGGHGGDSEQHNGSRGAEARADANITGAGAVMVRSEATGGNGGDGGANGRGGDGAIPRASAGGMSTGGDDVSATALLYGGSGGNGAYGGNGADVRTSGAVAGETSGSLQLYQAAFGGDAGAGLAMFAGSAGDASSSVGMTQDGPSEISILSEAVAGWGATGSGVPQAATADASVFASSSTASQISLRAHAVGGGGGSIVGAENYGGAAHGGDASVYGANAVSTAPSAIIDVTADVQGGRGGDNAGMGNAGNGAAVYMFDEVDGTATAGSTVILDQIARGGAGGSAKRGLAGDGGYAFARLDRTKDLEHLALQQSAYGGDGGNREFEYGEAGAGGNASVETRAVNSRSTVSAAIAAGGKGGGGTVAGRGGDAIARAFSQNATAADLRAYAEATSGNGGDADREFVSGGAPGRAQATAYGESTGGAAVDVAARQLGGDGGNSRAGEGGNGSSSFISDAAGGSTSGLLKLQQESRGGNGGSSSLRAGLGGTANSHLRAQNPDGGAIEGIVLAFGGDGGDGLESARPGDGGRAEAFIHLTGDAGDVLAKSESIAGRAGMRETYSYDASHGHASSEAVAETAPGFRAEARASTSAAVGMASATSITSGGAIDFTRFYAETRHTAYDESDFLFSRTSSVVTHGGIHPGTTTGDAALSYGSIMPTENAVASHLLGDPMVTAAYGAEGVSTAISLVTLGFNPASGTSLSRGVSAEFDFDLIELAQGRLVVGLLDPVSSSQDAQVTLYMNILRDGDVMASHAFSSIADAIVYFDDRVLDLGLMTPGDGDTPDLSISLEMTSPDPDAQFGVTMLVASVEGDPASFESDFDEDGDVDGRDLLEWQDGFGTSGASGALAGDADSDGDVDGHDFLTWQRQVGGGAASSTANASVVAEPACLIPTLVGMVPVLGCRRRRAGSAMAVGSHD